MGDVDLLSEHPVCKQPRGVSAQQHLSEVHLAIDALVGALYDEFPQLKGLVVNLQVQTPSFVEFFDLS